jgi:hypothetical protein
MEMKHLTILLLALLCVTFETSATSRQTYGSRRSGGDFDDDDTFDASGNEPSDDDDLEGSGDDGPSGDPLPVDRPSSVYIPVVTHSPPNGGISIDRMTTRWNDDSEVEIGAVENDDDDTHKQIIFLHPAVLAAMTVGGVLLIILIMLLIMFIVYRMRKKDEGSYVLDDPTLMIINGDRKHKSLIYTKAPPVPNDNEFYA